MLEPRKIFRQRAILGWLTDYGVVVCLTAIMTSPRSYVMLKLGLLAIYMAAQARLVWLRKRLTLPPRILAFYCTVGVAGVLWGLIGVVNRGALAGIQDNFRLWCIWSFAFVMLFSLLRNQPSLRRVHQSVVLSGILIALLNFAGLLDSYVGTEMFGYETRKELDMWIGFHDGYIQITSHNIGSLFFITAYLAAFHMRRDTQMLVTGWSRISLGLTLVIALLSGRRALWLCLLLIPFLLLGTAWITRSAQRLHQGPRRLMIGLVVAIFVLVPMAVVASRSFDNASLTHLMAAFSAEDERSIQMGYLIDGFLAHPVMGSGFGGILPYLRSYESPWLYELTYFQMLYNFGLVGMIGFLVVLITYLRFALRTIRKDPINSAIPFSILVGLLSFLVGVHSNPYLGSFDFLVILGFLPYLASFCRNFNEPDEAYGGVA